MTVTLHRGADQREGAVVQKTRRIHLLVAQMDDCYFVAYLISSVLDSFGATCVRGPPIVTVSVISASCFERITFCLNEIRNRVSSFFSSVGCADDEALTRLFQTSFLFVFWSLYQSW